MIPAILIAAYVIGWFITARTLLPHIADDMGEDDAADRALNAVMACLAALLWPAAGPVALILATSRKSPRQLQRELDQRDQRITELERELGIGDNDQRRRP